jgi:poly-gamma-glutamate capsule biosynthesis protein CapA/YwtB (metallophosphatase superfamily)
MQNVNLKFKIICLLSVFFLSGCVKNVDLRQQAKEEKAQEQKSISSMQGVADLEEGENSGSGQQAPSETFDVPESEPMKILFLGDMMFDRHIREAVGKYGGGDYNYIFESLKVKLSGYDLVVGNLEGPITENESVSVNTKIGEGKNFIFTFDPVVAKVLFDNNIKLVNLGNNHILNQGAKGIDQTKKYLDDAGVEYFDEDLALVKEISGMKIGFVSYNYSVSNSEDAAIEEIKLAKDQSDIVIVCPHWGTEYKVGDPGQVTRDLAHRFIEAGADLVVGTHPHVVQMSEEYNGKKIYYSLGNFVFDQYFQKETMEGLGAEITINPDRTMEFSELKFEMTKRGQTEIVQN